MLSALPLAQLDSVSLRVDGRALLVDINWTLNEGELWQVAGRPGSGKSLLLEVLCGRHSLAQGRRSYPALVGMHPDAAIGVPPRWALRLVSTEAQRRVAGQQATFYQARWHSIWNEPLTVAGFLEPERVYGLLAFEVVDKLPTPADYVQQRQEMVAELGLEGLEDRRVGQLSNGELRKLLLVAARLSQPKLLLLDDPLGGLDPGSRSAVAAAIRRSAERGQRIAFAASHRDEIVDLATHRIELDAGRVVASGTVQSASRAPGKTSSAEPVSQVSLELPKALRVVDSPYQGEHALVCRGVRAKAGETTLLEGIDWQVKPGEKWLLTGPNGAGKSTLLALLLGDHPQAYSNQIEVFGLRLGQDTTLWQRRSRIGHVAPELHWHYPGAWSSVDVVRSGARSSIGVHGSIDEQGDEVACAWLELIGIPESKWQQPFAALSEGEQRLILFARALCGKKKELVLLDEPTQGLGAVERERLFQVLDAVAAQRPLTLVLVTHYPDERPSCVSHHLALRNGRIASIGPIRE